MNSILRRGICKVLNANRYTATAIVRQLSLEVSRNTDNWLSYDEVITKRRAEAARSIVVQVNSEKSFSELCKYCSDFGTIVNAQHYRIYNDDLHYILIEYSSEKEATDAIGSSAYNEDLSGVPVRSPFLWFKAGTRKSQRSAQNDQQQSLQTIEGTRLIDNGELNDILQSAQNIDDQIKVLYELTKLNDLGIRLRFLSARQIERSIVGMFPEANAQPFGSSVNGFGKMGCDLDLILRFDNETGVRGRPDSRLVFHTKEHLTNGRSQTQRQMESLGDMLQLFLPGVCHVRRILQARVPIIKYHHEHLNLEVDLSMSNLTGAYMSELFYMFGEFDERVRPLIFCIRRWAQACGLTNPSPGRWISNFSLTCMVIFFLQQMKQPILPSISLLMKSATRHDIRVTEDGVNCTFGRDLKTIDFKTKNSSKLHELLLQFYEFYSQFDFGNRAISLNEGRAVSKPDHSSLYIVNPLEQVLNVSKNVSIEECERLRIELRNAAWILDSELENTLTQAEQLESSWGILKLFRSLEKTVIRPNMFFKARMVEVSDLFDKKTAPIQSTEVAYKNLTVKQQVQSIKAQGRNDLKLMRMNSGTTGNSKGHRR